MGVIRIIVADGHPLFREGVCSLLSSEVGIEVKGTGNIKDIYRMKGEFHPDIVLLDWGLIKCHQSDTCLLLKQHKGNTGILIMSENGFDQNILENLRSGAMGFVSKNISREDLLLAIRTVAKGDFYFCKDAAKIVVAQITYEKPWESNELENILSKREMDILKYISLGFTNSEIAEKLFISSHTVATHRRNLLQKINVKNTAGLVRYASKLGLLN
jgi:DNA-binding NarL/FixJ family response regulator